MYNFTYLPYMQPMFYYRYEKPGQVISQVEQQCDSNLYQVPLIIQSSNELQHQTLSDVYTNYIPQTVATDATNFASEQNSIHIFGNKTYSPSITEETNRSTYHSFEQFQGGSSIYDKNKKKQHINQCEQLSILDLSQISSNKISSSHAILNNPQKQGLFSEDYRIASYRHLEPGQQIPMKIVTNHCGQQLKNSENFPIKNEEIDGEEDHNQNQQSQQIISSLSSSYFRRGQHSTNQNNLKFLSSTHSNYTNLKQPTNCSETKQQENCQLDQNLFVPLNTTKNIKSSSLKKRKSSKPQEENECNQSTNKKSQKGQTPITGLQQGCLISDEEEESINPLNQNSPLESINAKNSIQNRLCKKRKLNNDASFDLQRNEGLQNNLGNERVQQTLLPVVDDLKSSLVQQQSLIAAIEEIQSKDIKLTQIERLSRCVFILQQSECHKAFQQILKQPFFLNSDNSQQSYSTVKSPLILNSQSNVSKHEQSSKMHLEQQQSHNSSDKRLVINSSVPLQSKQNYEKSCASIQTEKRQPVQTLFDQKSQANLGPSAKAAENPIRIIDLQESIRRQMVISPRDTKMLNLYNFSVMRDFPERKSANTVNNNGNNSSSNNNNPTIQNESQQIQNDDVNLMSIHHNINNNNNNQLEEDDDEEFNSDSKQQSISLMKKQKKNKKKTLYSRFHNLNKLFIYNIMAMLQSENLENFNIPQYLRVELISFLKRLKLSGKIRPSSDNPIETETFAVESFSHVHYNVLFLKINESNISIIRKSPRDVFLHKLCFNVDLNNCLDIEIIKINILKKIIFQIFIQSIQEHLYVDDHTFSKSNNRVLYTIKAIRGIKKLSLGIYFNRF